MFRSIACGSPVLAKVLMLKHHASDIDTFALPAWMDCLIQLTDILPRQ